MGSNARIGGIVRRLDVPRLLLGAALGVFGSLLLGAFGMATAAWASEVTAEAQGLAAVTDPLTAKVSDTSRLAARLVPHDQLGHGTPADERSVPRLVSGLTAPVGSLVNESADGVRTAFESDAPSGLVNGKSVGDSAAGALTPLLGTLVDDASAVAHRPADAVSGVYATVAPVTDEVDVLALLVTDGLGTTSDEAPPGSALLADGRGQPSSTALQQVTVPTEVAAAPDRAQIDRSAAVLECSAADMSGPEADSDTGHMRRAPIADAAQPWTHHGQRPPHLSVIPGGASGSTAGISVDSGHSAVDVAPCTAAEQVSLARTVIGELGRPMDRAAELSVAPD